MHTYGLEWTPNEIKWYFDGVELSRTFPCNDFTPNHALTLITNLALRPHKDVGDISSSNFPATMEIDYIRVYKKKWTTTYGYDAGGWRNEYHRRLLADVNGDGKDDIVGFGWSGVVVALAYEDDNGPGFRYPRTVLSDFCYNQGWRVDKHEIHMADVNGDGISDIVGFGDEGVEISLGVETSSYTASFTAPTLYINTFGNNQGWNDAYHRRMVADVNGDGKDDIIGFGWNGVVVALAKVDANGFGFRYQRTVLNDFCYNQGWRVNEHKIHMADVNGDGIKDIVGFGDQGVKVALGDDQIINYTAKFSTPSWQITNNYGNNQGWNDSYHRRMVADVNGDGMDDIIGFGWSDVAVSLAKIDNNGFGFRYYKNTYINDYCYSQGWRNNSMVVELEDINGDGAKDIIGFGNDGVTVSLGVYTTDWANFNFQDIYLWRNYYGNSADAGGFSMSKNPRLLADLNGDNKKDIVCFGDNGVLASLSEDCFRSLNNIEIESESSLKSTEVINSQNNYSDLYETENCISIYPNPAKGFVNVAFEELEEKDYKIVLVNYIGQIVYSNYHNESQINIDIANQTNGLYIMNIFKNNSLIKSEKFVINN